MRHRSISSLPGSRRSGLRSQPPAWHLAWLLGLLLGVLVGCGSAASSAGSSGSGSSVAEPEQPASEPGPSSAARRVAVGTPFPALSFPLLDGGVWTSASHRGQVMVLDIWATYCEPCLKAFPKLERWRTTYPDLAIIGLSVDEEDDVVREFLAKAGVGFPIARDPELSVRESELEIATIPALFVVDGEGVVQIRRDLMTVDDYDKVESEIAQLLESSTSAR